MCSGFIQALGRFQIVLCFVSPQAMKMSRRSADVNQRALAYSRMVDGLNEFR